METIIGGLRVRYFDSAVTEAEPHAKTDGISVTSAPVLFLHGWGVDHTLYRPLLDHLAQSRRVVAPDLPGFGGSEEPPEPWDAARYANFAVEFAQKVGLTRPQLIGHSNGGRTILKLFGLGATQALDPSRVVLMGCAGLPAHHSLSYYCKVYSFKAAKRFYSLPPMKKLFPNAIDNARKKRGSADYQNASPVMRTTLVNLLREDLTPALSRVNVPTLLLWGENDTATPLSDGQKMEKVIPDAGLVVYPGGTHYAFLEQFGRTCAVLDSFLK